MVYGAYLVVNEKVLFNSDYSSDSGLKLTGTIFSERSLTTAFNLTGYTLTLRIYKNGSDSDQFNQACTITTAASGTWYLQIASNTLPVAGVYYAKMELSKSGTVISTLNDQEILIKKGPTV